MNWYQYLRSWWYGWFFIRRWPVLTQLTKFALVGTSSFVVDMSVYAALTRLAHIHYLLANSISFLVAVAWSFTWNQRWTFRAIGSLALAKQYTKFLAVSIGGLLLASGLLYVFVAGMGVHDLIAKFVIAIIVMFWNFSLNKLWTFR